MKVLVYGAGVIGGQIIHTLCACEHDVTVIARGAWAASLREQAPDFPMPRFDRLRAMIPPWETVRMAYGGAK